MNEDSKIEEAEFFLAHIEKAADDERATRFYASAFLSAARSALQYVLKEVTPDSGGQTKQRCGVQKKARSDGQNWYDAQVSLDPLVRFLKDRRDINIHKRPLPMRTNISIRIPDTRLPDNASTTTFDYSFQDWTEPEKDLLALCKRYISEIKRIVADGRTKGFLS
jgi:hypothetical protein